MVNKYPGACGTCGNRVPAHGGVVRKQGRKWVTYHVACDDSGLPEVIHSFFVGGDGRTHHVYRNRRGRCEDAPCCGCCS